MDPAVEAVEVLLTTGGMPMNARIEILQGPDTNKQAGPGNHAEAMAPRTLHRWCCFDTHRTSKMIQFCFRKDLFRIVP